MTPEQKTLIQSSFQRLMTSPDAFAAAFYARVFALDPEARELFHIDMQEQGKKFTAMMQTALDCMEHLDKIVPALWQMGKRHGGYGVQSEHYETVRVALVEAMKERDGAAFTPETEAAWNELYDIMAATMEQAASEGIIPRANARPAKSSE